MNLYKEFHGDIVPSEIGKRLRVICQKEKVAFKILTGYGATSLRSNSKVAALSSLRNMQKQGIIKAYFPGEVRNQVLKENSTFYTYKALYEQAVKSDADYGNDGIIFVFIK